MNTLIEIKLFILEAIKQLPVCVPDSMEVQWYVRCPYCGDSKDLSHGHLSIKIDTKTDEPILWRCFKCGECGILTETLLNDLGIVIDSEHRALLKASIKKGTVKNKFLNSYIEKIVIPTYYGEIAYRNLTYINSRLGTDISINEAKKYSIILDLDQFLSENGIDNLYNISKKMRAFIQNNYVGFLSTSKNKIILRLVNDIPSAKRYLKFPLNPYNKNPASFYNIPSAIDILSPEKIHIHIAEGIFDIISIERSLINEKERQLFFASCGFGYGSILQFLIYNGIGGNIILHIYADNDKSDYNII